MYKFTIIPKTHNPYSDAIIKRLDIREDCRGNEEAERLCRKWTTKGFCDYLKPIESGDVAKVYIPAESIQMVTFEVVAA